MSFGKELLEGIDAAQQSQDSAEAQVAELTTEINQYIFAVAANEVSYELQAPAPLMVEADLGTLALAIETGRVALRESVELAIEAAKQSFRARHQQTVLRNQLVLDVETDANS